MDPITAISGAVKIGGALLTLFGSGSSSNPTNSVIFETYDAVLVINKRLGDIEDGLSSIHYAVTELSKSFDDKLEVQTEKQYVERLMVALSHQETAYRAFLADLLSSDRSAGEISATYYGELKREMTGLRAATTRVSQFAPLSLDVALTATAIELYVYRQLPNEVNNPRTWAEERIDDIRTTANGELAERIETARVQMEAEKAAVAQLISFSDEDWATGTEAIILKGSYHTRWQKFANFNCLPLRRTMAYEPSNLRLIEPATDEPFGIVRFGEPDQIAGPACGSELSVKDGRILIDSTKVTTIGGPSVSQNDVLGNVKNVLVSPSGWIPVRTFVVDSFNQKLHENAVQRNSNWDALTEASTAINRLNIATARYALLLQYRDDVLAGATALEAKLDVLTATQDTGSIDELFANELSDISRLNSAEMYATLNKRSDELLEDAHRRFVEEIAEAGVAADDQIAAGFARVQAAIERHENRRDSNIATTLKKVSAVLEIIKATQSINDAIATSSQKASLGETITLAANPQGREDGAAQPDQEAQPQRPDQRWDEVRGLLDELKEAGLPTGNPNWKGLTRQEEIAGQLSDILVAWGPTQADELYDRYQAQRETSQEDLVSAAMDLNLFEAGKIVLREALVPTMIAPQELGSIQEKHRFQAEAEPWLEAIRSWRLGTP